MNRVFSDTENKVASLRDRCTDQHVTCHDSIWGGSEIGSAYLAFAWDRVWQSPKCLFDKDILGTTGKFEHGLGIMWVLKSFLQVKFSVLVYMKIRDSLTVQWLGPSAFTTKGLGLIPGEGPKIPWAMQHVPAPTPSEVVKVHFLLLLIHYLHNRSWSDLY